MEHFDDILKRQLQEEDVEKFIEFEYNYKNFEKVQLRIYESDKKKLKEVIGSLTERGLIISKTTLEFSIHRFKDKYTFEFLSDLYLKKKGLKYGL